MAGYEIETKEEEILSSAYTDLTCPFVIEAQPGTYVLVSPGRSTSDNIARDDTSTALLIKVEADKSVDVGKIELSP